MGYFPEPAHSKNKIEVQLSKSDLKNLSSVEALQFDENHYLFSLKLEVYNFDIGKIETTPVDLVK